jgi:transglutaminase-like putative cysteine protease
VVEGGWVVTESLSLTIRHHTGFTYDGIAKSSYNEARMTPITSAHQEVRHSHLAVQPVVPLSTHVDYFGTAVTAFDIQEPHSKLEVEARSSVESRAATLERSLSWSELREPTLVDFFSEYLLETERTALAGDALGPIDEWARSLGVHELVDAVGEYVRNRITYVPGATSVSATAQEAWDQSVGVCQDITHVTIGLLRSLGLPTRYVSGYLYPSDDAEVGVTVAGQSHAWVEYFSGSWTGMDPTNGIRETERHIIVGNGRDYDDVAPLKGVYQGAAASSLGVIVEMSRSH